MYKYLIRKLIISLLLICLSSIAFFWLIRIIPGSPVGKIVGHENYSVEVKDNITKKYGLDKSISEQFIIYTKNLFKGDFGYSYLNKKDVKEIIATKIVPTLILVLPSIFISYFLGIYLAIKGINNTKMKYYLDKITALTNSFPTYILCIILIILFAYNFKIFPIVGMNNSKIELTGINYLLDVIWHSILPILSIVIIDASYFYRITISSIEEEKEKDYYLFFKTNGLSEETITKKYIIKNAIMPTINILGLSATRVVTGALYVEILFAWPGMGRLIYESILSRDYLILSSSFILIVTFISLFMFLIEIIYAIIDPRIRES